MHPHLKERWLRLLGVEADNLWLAELDKVLEYYSEPHRAYHTLRHIEHCLAELDEAQGIVSFDIRTLELAIWYHDVIYDTKSKGNEQASAELAKQVLFNHGFAHNFIEAVFLMIMDTAHENSEIERYDSMLMLDIDLAILGQPEERFDEYEREVRIEYQWVPEEAFRTGRAAILQMFLDRPSIYRTPHFQGKYEVQARKNLRRSIQQLTSA